MSEFSQMRATLFGLMEKYPDMRWDVVDSRIVVHLNVNEDTAHLFQQAKQLFA